MSYVVNDIADKLEDEGLGTVGTSIFVGYMPADMTGISVIDTGGMQPNKDIPTREPTFQVFIKSVDYLTGKGILEAVYGALQSRQNVNLGDNFYYFILAMSEGGHLGREENGCDLFSINFHCRTR